MSRIFTKSLVAASALVLFCGAAQARNFFEQAGIDIGNGVKAVGRIVAPPAPAPKPAPGPMSPCTSAPGACGTAPKG
jgi:hypothetical protein